MTKVPSNRILTPKGRVLLAIALLSYSMACCQPRTIRPSNPSAPGIELALPAYDASEHILVYEGFTASYNHSTLVPNWVAYDLTSEETQGEYTSGSNFSRDPHLKGRQASREDYSHSGWDKGHMAPKADLKWSEKAWWESHYFTNICPQDRKMNGGDWNRLEQLVRRLARQYGNVYVVCGPIFDSCVHGTIGQAMVQVPDAFFKALLVPVDGSYQAVAFVMHNDSRRQPPEKVAMTVNELEQMIGRDLFPTLDDSVEETIESAYNPAVWGFDRNKIKQQ